MLTLLFFCNLCVDGIQYSTKMSGCLDRVRCRCDWLDPAVEWLKPKRNMFASIISGTLVCSSTNPQEVNVHVCSNVWFYSVDEVIQAVKKPLQPGMCMRKPV